MAKKADATPPAPQTFEASIEELEGILSGLEDGALPLDESLAGYERGMKLLEHCRALLAKAEQKLQTVVATPEGTLEARPADGGGA